MRCAAHAGYTPISLEVLSEEGCDLISDWLIVSLHLFKHETWCFFCFYHIIISAYQLYNGYAMLTPVMKIPIKDYCVFFSPSMLV